ncbi:uncharacterized protein LOC112091693 [Morus notabilis]|uniref:uncharacterized protein LOC112091693 n=1 Tax=Morus notabilis TaxID=981085 RepID=UPI000CECF2F4|nr:uncharacterized protein LOC112091693 [Morus notabilis]
MPPRHRAVNPPAVPNEEIMEAMYVTFQGMATRANNDRPAGDRKQGYFLEFICGSIPTFNSEGGPQEAEYLFESIIKYLNTMGVPEEYWVEFAAYKFEGQASTWWKQTRRLHDVSTMTWELFEELFNERYFPQSYGNEKAMEFMGLEQGDMTMREYKAKFNDLSHFAPTLVESEHMNCFKFEKGLKNNVQKSLAALRIHVYRDLVALAISVEQDNLAYL